MEMNITYIDWIVNVMGNICVILGIILILMVLIYALGKLLAMCLNYIMGRWKVFNEVKYYIVYRNEIRKWVKENKQRINKDFNNN